MVRADLSFANPSWPMMTSSILMQPPAASIILKSPNVSDDFPAPVRPTIPTFSPELILNETPRIK